MNATHFVEVWKSNISDAKNGLLLPIDYLEESLAHTIRLNLMTIAIFKIKFKIRHVFSPILKHNFLFLI